jgi:hypothetical protein
MIDMWLEAMEQSFVPGVKSRISMTWVCMYVCGRIFVCVCVCVCILVFCDFGQDKRLAHLIPAAVRKYVSKSVKRGTTPI